MGAVSPRLVGGATLSAIQMAKSAMANATARTITTSTRCRMSKPGMDRDSLTLTARGCALRLYNFASTDP